MTSIFNEPILTPEEEISYYNNRMAVYYEKIFCLLKEYPHEILVTNYIGYGAEYIVIDTFMQQYIVKGQYIVIDRRSPELKTLVEDYLSIIKQHQVNKELVWLNCNYPCNPL